MEARRTDMLTRSWWCSGQYTMEWGMMMAALVIAAILMNGYVRQAMRAGVKTTEMQLNGAMRDNRP